MTTKTSAETRAACDGFTRVGGEKNAKVDIRSVLSPFYTSATSRRLVVATWKDYLSPISTTRVDGPSTWLVETARPSTRVMETSHPSTRAVNSGGQLVVETGL